ncbi:Excinuclease ABC subunit C [Lachnospiraceae bacterium TWA4]|nr:Excinuclease ABC subunit C [Lachnospiraceae bacterium TWA4]
MKDFNIQEELKKLPTSPGVYFMHNKRDEIIYVGKAINLKNRVRQYFQSSRNKTAKIQKMVSHIAWFEYIMTDSELEALILESNMIKKHQPRYNTMLKDDKNYPYIKVTVEEDFPRILMARTRKNDKAKYFGPYMSVDSVKETISLLQKIFKIRTCKQQTFRNTTRACLNYHIGQCEAPCMKKVSKEVYKKRIDKVIEFLNGKNYQEVVEVLTQNMLEASQNLDFEKAALYRDQIQSVRTIEEKQKITTSEKEDRDILAVAHEHTDAIVQVFFVRNGRLVGRDYFHIYTDVDESDAEILESFIKQFYQGSPHIPRELFLPVELNEEELIKEWLTTKRGQAVNLVVPKKGEKQRMVQLARRNAILMLSRDRDKARREHLRTLGAARDLADILRLPSAHRIEAYDISNISGFHSVGSMVVFEDGKAKNNDYRKFKIKSVEGPNDYASMEEVLTRRFEHEADDIFGAYPNLILMDGGKGQVGIAKKVLEQMNLKIPVCGMVKDDYHRTRGLYFNDVELPIDTHSEVFKLITRVQDEAHRFAIEYHRSLRGKGQIHSILDEIPGVGTVRRREIMKKYPSIDDLKVASMNDLMEIPRMNEQTAKNIYEFFRK